MKSNFKNTYLLKKVAIIILLLNVIFVNCYKSKAQEVLNYYSFHSNKTPKTDLKNNTYLKSLNLPFFDDFSQNAHHPVDQIFPNANIWVDSNVYINNTFGLGAPSYGMATFDGIDKGGNPYNNIANSFGLADILTSKDIDLSSYSANDSIYLSFFYQAKGLANFPNIGDSLVLQFCDTSINWTDTSIIQNWVTVWGVDGYSNLINSTPFIQVLIPVIDGQYFNNKFAFRFYNKATLSGINDHWNLDYVKMNWGRNLYDTILNDVAFTNTPSKILKNYYSMPYNHFIANKNNELQTSTNIEIKNNWSVLKNVSYKLHTVDGVTGSNIARYPAPSTIISPLAYATPSPDFSPLYGDSIINLTSANFCNDKIITDSFSLSPGASEFFVNDKLIRNTYFKNYFAYDDGTAERAYGLQGDLSRLALEFTTNVADTLKAVQIHFAHFNSDVSTKLFNLMVWQTIDKSNSGATEVILKQQKYLKPIYVNRLTDTLMGFATYVLDTALYLPPGTYYVGWQQLQADLLNIGFDINNDAHTHLYYNSGTAGGWYQSSYNGSVMLRPVMQGPCVPGNTQINNLNTINNISIQPNPVANILYINNSENKNLKYEVYNILGKLYSSGNFNNNATIDMQQAFAGIYFIKFIDVTGNTKTIKFIKQ